MKRFLRAWGPALLWAALIFTLSSRSRVPGPDFPNSDKVAHFGAYAILGLALAYGAARSGAAPLWMIVLGSLYGASDEVHQSFVPGRSPDVADWVADSAGAIVGVLAFQLIHSRRRVRGGTAPADADSAHL